MSAVEVLLEQAVVDLLAADAGVRVVLGDPVRVKMGDGEKPVYPFLEISAHQSRPADAIGSEGSEHIVDVSVASQNDRGQGGLEALGAIRMALKDADLVMEGWRSVLIDPVFADLQPVTRGVWRAILRVRIVVENA